MSLDPLCSSILGVSNYYIVLIYGRNRKVILEAPIYDKDCVLGNILAAHYLSSSDHSRANSFVEAATSNLEQSTPYEKAVFEAVIYLISADRDDDLAFEMHTELLKRFPKDLASLKRAQVLCFYMGQPEPFLGLVQQVLPVNQEESYIHGMLAFPLLELGRMEEAAAASRKGYEINKEDAWAHHCLCHVLQHECRFKEAVEFMEERSESWPPCSSFMYTHNWWHVALCYLEGGAPLSKVEEIYDDHIWKELEKDDAVPPEVYLNALGLLLRLDVRDALDGFGDRLKVVAVRLTDQANWYLEWHLDILIVWALAKVGETSRAHELLEGLKFRLSKMNTKKQQVMQKGIQLGEAVYEFARGNYKEALELLGSEFNVIGYKIVGASDEQIDVFNEMWCQLLLKTGQSSTAEEVIRKKLKVRDGVPFIWRLLEKSYIMEGNAEARSAGDRAKTLESSNF
ncbi:PREDICTED: tetratricopeptide repeat protein 38-like isoform X2 [Camelina sativa]|uniref:Tetratricopeptide repeat protein 38-like isoform X2 n=1 Tax=Camelina sativa TaxID=90675 RepID=A0ABM1R822_CAMSA|nr:PREDICTED: tetratricopeptide repeat protein 38-like isoform X2 [Camelina sativa]